MGNCCDVEGAVDHWIYVKTGDRKGGFSTEGSVTKTLAVRVEDVSGHHSDEKGIRLPCEFKSGEEERGKTHVFQASNLDGFSEIARIELWREDGPPDATDWYVEVIVINNRRTEKSFHFPVLRWVREGTRLNIELYDTNLPQYDHNADERKKELERKQEEIGYGQSAPDLPVQCANLPKEEQFSDEYKYDITNAQHLLLDKAGGSTFNAQSWQSLEELTNIYSAAMPEPMGIERWSNDLCFGAQRLVGCNPMMVKLCTELPENMGVTAEMLRPFLEGWTLKQIIDAKRLFVVDLKILDKIPTQPGKTMCAPIALFFVTGDKQFVPIGIQLYQHIAPDNPVFLPNDPPFTWLLAKMWFNNADAAVHQAISHYTYSHLLMESTCLAMLRMLAPPHPVFKLLISHFLFLPTVNARSLDPLFNPGGWLDKTTSLGREGMFELMRRGSSEWRMDVHGTLPKELEIRKVLDNRVLPNYGYRDDGMLLYKAIETYVGKIIRYYYDSLNKIKGDTELQNWAKELTTSKQDGGAGLQGVPGNGEFKRVEDISMVCTSIIYTCTVHHAAVNYPQYDEYGFPPNYPAVLNNKPPKDKMARTEGDIVAILPDKGTTLEIMSITKLYSTRPDKRLFDWEFQFQYDPVALKAEKEFCDDLAVITEKIKQRNKDRGEFLKYDTLIPGNIPNNICI